MRAGALLILASIGAAPSFGFANAAPASTPVTVAEIVAAPRAFNGQRLRVQGFLIGTNGWMICSQPLKRDAGWRANYGAAHCIDFHNSGHAFDAQAEKYHGAVVVIDGIYWNRCLPDVRAAEPEFIRAYCEQNAMNGELGAIRVDIKDYVDLRDPVQDTSTAWAEVDLASPAAAGIDGFVKAFAAAASSRDVEALVRLFDVRERGRRRVWLKAPTSREHWLFLESDLAPRRAAAIVPSSGYRLYQTVSVPRALCFCRAASCEGRWRGLQVNILELRSIASPTACFSVTTARGSWLLD